MAEYALSIDETRLEDWGELFAEGCDYKVVTRENVEQGAQRAHVVRHQEHAARPG